MTVILILILFFLYIHIIIIIFSFFLLFLFYFSLIRILTFRGNRIPIRRNGLKVIFSMRCILFLVTRY
jgi:hypothetical protein